MPTTLTGPRTQAVSLNHPKHLWSDLTPWERRCTARAASDAILTDVAKRRRAGEEVPRAVVELGRYGLMLVGTRYRCGQFQVPYDCGRRAGLRGYLRSQQDDQPIIFGFEAEFSAASGPKT